MNVDPFYSVISIIIGTIIISEGPVRNWRSLARKARLKLVDTIPKYNIYIYQQKSIKKFNKKFV